MNCTDAPPIGVVLVVVIIVALLLLLLLLLLKSPIFPLKFRV